MRTKAQRVRAESFQANLELWVALSHFLPAELVYELAVALVSRASSARVQFDDLCEAHISYGESSLSCWNVNFKPGKEGFERYLQHVVRALAWQRDTWIERDTQKFSAEEAGVAKRLTFAFRLARADLRNPEAWSRESPEGANTIEQMVSSLTILEQWARSGTQDETLSEVVHVCDGIETPLQSVLLKHLGDLCADIDQPAAALKLYSAADSSRTSVDRSIWLPLVVTLDAVILQSRAAMVRLTEGPAESQDMLSTAFASVPFTEHPLLRTNAAEDLMNAHLLTSEKVSFPENIQSALLIAPLLVNSHGLTDAFEYLDAKKYTEAFRCFWARLRRQVAVGSATAVRETKAYYGRAILEGISGQISSQNQPENFSFALRLLVESGRDDIIELHDWPQSLLQMYLTPEAVQRTICHANQLEGARAERHLALVALAKGWLMNIPADTAETARTLFAVLASSVKDWPWRFNRRTIAHSALKALEDVAHRRPELRSVGSRAVTDAVVQKLSDVSFRAKWAALDTILAFAEGLEGPDLKLSIGAALDVLASVEPAEAGWPIVRPALSLLTCPNARLLWSADRDLGARCAEAVIRFGLGSQTEGTRLLFLLRDLGPYVTKFSSDANELIELVSDVRSRAKVLNSSGTTTAIAALLAAPAVVGFAGVRDAIAGLTAILESAQSDHPSIALASAYEPILLLSQQREQIIAELNITYDQFRELVGPVIGPLEMLWLRSVVRPLLFTTFEIPASTVPNAAIVHNWAFATLGFARTSGAVERLTSVLQRASQNDLLRPHIEVARAVRLNVGDFELFDSEAIQNESRAAFYAALGPRLVLVANDSTSDRLKKLPTLLKGCLQKGPNALDASVFALAIEAGVRPGDDLHVPQDYAARVRYERDLNLSLLPLLRALFNGPGF